jgi:hypothetical protein
MMMGLMISISRGILPVILTLVAVVYSADGTKIGNTYFSSDGNVTKKIGNTYFHSDGSHTTQRGNFYYDSDGTYTQVVPNQQTKK